MIVEWHTSSQRSRRRLHHVERFLSLSADLYNSTNKQGRTELCSECRWRVAKNKPKIAGWCRCRSHRRFWTCLRVCCSLGGFPQIRKSIVKLECQDYELHWLAQCTSQAAVKRKNFSLATKSNKFNARIALYSDRVYGPFPPKTLN